MRNENICYKNAKILCVLIYQKTYSVNKNSSKNKYFQRV